MPNYLVSLSVLLALAGAASGACNSTCRPDGTAPSGAKYRVCTPDPACWNGDLVVFAHGYVDPALPVAIPEDQLKLPDGSTLPALINQLGFAFAVTSYSTNGLAIRPAVAELSELVGIFNRTSPQPSKHTYLTGVSEGSLAVVLSLENNPLQYTGALAACGPVGDFTQEVDYLGDFRVVFDYFFPGILPGSALSIPPELPVQWDSVYAPRIQRALANSPLQTLQLLNVTKASTDVFDPTSVSATVLELLRYNVFATTDLIAKLGGQPFDNSQRVYSGSLNDPLLNLLVRRYHRDSAAAVELFAHYRTTGRIARPLVTIHTIADPLIPYDQEQIYGAKTQAAGAGSLHANFPVFRYGHCNFQESDVLFGFVDLLLSAAGNQ